MTLTETTARSAMPGGLTIRDFGETDAEYAALTAIENACYPEYPGTEDEWRHDDATRPAHHKYRRWLAALDGELVGYASHYQFEGMFHPRRFGVSVVVHPEHQGKGVGRVLYNTVLAGLAPHDPLSLRTNIREDVARAMRFAADRGFVEDSRSWESRLDVMSFDPAPFAGAEERALAAGITITTMAELQARDPEHRRKLYALDVEATKDEPHPEPPTTPSPEVYDSWVFDDPSYLPEGNFVALDGERYVGMSTLRTAPASPDELYVGFTGVLREYRGKGIAMALKLRTLAFARERGTRTIKTWNSTLNRPMLRINEALGFAKQPAWVSLVKRLSDE